ncbi:MAG: sigma-70 family RNA polymerase sigma factor [Acidobacteria bacterium]|nr:sigma-70 family RNA polymerase sigma factor [Acidobacteriota bacterium]
MPIPLEEFARKFNKEITEIFFSLTKHYSLTKEIFANSLYTITDKYLLKNSEACLDRDIITFLMQLNCQELCFAIACAQGDESAWDEFMRDYRGFLQSVAHQLTRNETLADELVEIAWSELYGLREVEGKRVSKFSAYSGKGSLKGWLRAVLFQLSVDRHRRQNRYVQPEEENDLERLAAPVAHSSEKKTELSDRYQIATHKALTYAITSLDSRMKVVINYYYYDNLTLKQIGQVFGVHEATASRWVQKIQQDIRQIVEKFLKQEYGFNNIQIKECLEYAAQGEGVDIKSLLTETEPPSRGP